MWTMVENILEIPAMEGAQIIAGHEGLSRNINSVTILDAPDAAQWLSGNELVLTSTFPLVKRREHLHILIEELVARNVAAMGVKLHRYMTELPPAMIQRANELAFPIISVPDQVAWIEIINPIFMLVLDSDVQKLIRSEEIRGQFTAQLFSGASLEGLMALLHSMLHLPVVLISPSDEQTICLPSDEDTTCQALHLLRARDVPTEREPMNSQVLRRRDGRFSIVYLPLGNDPEPQAYIAAVEADDSNDEFVLYCLLSAREAIFMSLLQRRANVSIAREKKNEFVQMLVDASFSAPTRLAHIARGRKRGIPLHDSYVAVLVKFHNLDEISFRSISSHFHTKLETEHLLTSCLDSSRFLLLLPHMPETALELDGGTEHISHYIEKACADSPPGLDWNAGISQVTELVHLDRAFEQADYALSRSLESGRRCEAKQHDETSLFRLLSHPAMQSDAQRFVTEWLQPLLDYDRVHHSRLVDTLRTFLDMNGNYRETARLMHVHYNTVRYRTSKIQSLSRNVLNPRLRLQYQLALVLHDMERDL